MESLSLVKMTIQIVNMVAEPRIYQVKTSGDDVRNFFVGITPTQNTRHGVKFFIQTWCAQHRDKVVEERRDDSNRSR